MALVASLTDGAATVTSNEPFIITEVNVTLTGDGSAVESGATAGAATAFAHAGPAGLTPLSVLFVMDADSSTGGELLQFWYTVDTTNNEIDAHWTTAAAIANTETVTGKLVCTFLEKAPDAGQSDPVGYTAPGNSNI